MACRNDGPAVIPALVAVLSVPGLGLLCALLRPVPPYASELAAYADPDAVRFGSVDSRGFF